MAILSTFVLREYLSYLADLFSKQMMDMLLFRWFDKCFQLIVDAQGMATINFEHSWGDGVAILRLMEESFCDTKQNHFVHPNQIFNVEAHLGSNFRPVGWYFYIYFSTI